MANQIARPIGRLIHAAERVRGGDLAVRVPEAQTEDEIAGLSRAFNRMTGQLAAQRTELMDAYSQIDERRRFTETVLAGVSAGRDRARREGPGRAAQPRRRRAARDRSDGRHRPGSRANSCPEFAALIDAARRSTRTGRAPRRSRSGRQPARAPCWCGSAPSCKGGRTDGFVVTFDDITELQSAQRKAAWADVARRIAHEIKNPLTPIQLSAERLKRRFAQGDHLRPRHLRAVHRHDRAACRRHRPHGRRVLGLRADAAAGDPARGCRPHRARGADPADAPRGPRSTGAPTSPSRGPWRPATAGCSGRR